jgi:AcrR family transcriptional regulator
MKRDKEATKQKLIDAVSAIVLRDGFPAIGINSIAREAGVDKVLIYRYYGDLDGLLTAYVSQKDYFSNIKGVTAAFEKIETREDVLRLSKAIFVGQFRDILVNRELQEIALWEMSASNSVTAALARAREEQGMSILKEIRKVTGKTDADVPAMAALILGGIYYIVLRSRSVDVFNGIDLRSPRGWKRIEKSIEMLIDRALE